MHDSAGADKDDEKLTDDDEVDGGDDGDICNERISHFGFTQ